MSTPILEHWTSCPTQSSETLIFPDGCRDVLFVRQPGAHWHWWVTELDERARSIRVAAGAEYLGWRLRPGVSIDFTSLKSALHGVPPEKLEISRIAECCTLPCRTTELLAILAESSDAQSAADLAGTSLRTLQRTTLSLLGRSPLFWTRLARVRRAAMALQAGTTAIEAAAQLGFTDQPHLTREFKRWFGVTPRQVQQNDAITAGISESGFASHTP